MIYKKLYTKKLNFPEVIPYIGINDDINSNYYILLEKNYFPITASLSIKILNITGTTNWFKTSNIKLETKDNYYNKLSITGNISQNNNPEINSALIEISATISATGTKKPIENCNTLQLYIEQAPKEIIDAKIEFIPLNETQTLSENNLNINGDKQYIKFYYYGLKNTAKMVNSLVKLTIDNSDLDNNKIISKRITSNGIEIIYELDEYIPANNDNKVYNLNCTYTTEYNVSGSCTAKIIQKPNVYEIVIDSIEPANNIPALPQTNYIIKYHGKKNNDYITSDIKLKYLYHNSDPIINYNKIITKPYNNITNQFETILQINDNILPIDLKLDIQAVYSQQYKSQIITITQQSASLNNITLHIVPLFNADETDTIMLSGVEREYQFKYYVEYNGKQYINAPENSYTIAPITTNNFITSEVTTFEVISDVIVDNIPNYPYKLLTIKTTENNDENTIINGNITVSFLGKQKTITLKQTANTISIEILLNSTEIIGGLNDIVNTIIIKCQIIYNGDIITDVRNVICTVINGNEHVNEDELKKLANEPDIITITCPVKTLYENINNTPVPITFLIKFKNIETEYTVQRYPVAYDSSIYCSNIQEEEDAGSFYYDINGNNDTVADICFCGLIYNSETDHDNFIYDLNVSKDNLTVTVDNQPLPPNYDYFKLGKNITKTNEYVLVQGYFYINDSGIDPTIGITFTYTKLQPIEKTKYFKLSMAEIDITFFISAIGYKENNRVVYQSSIPSYLNTFNLNPLRENVIQVCAELKTGDKALDIDEPGTFEEIITADNSTGKFEYTSDEPEIENEREYKIYYIKPHFNINQNDKPYIKIGYNAGLYKGEDLYINEKYINLKKNNLTGTFFISFNSDNIQLEKTITNKNQTITCYFVYSYYNEADNVYYYDNDKSHYTVQKSSTSTINVDLTETTVQNIENGGSVVPIGGGGAVPIPFGAGNSQIISGGTTNNNIISNGVITLGNVQCYYDNTKNKFVYTINIPANTQVTQEKFLLFNFIYENKNEPYYNVKIASDNLKLTQRGNIQDYVLTFRLSDNINQIDNEYILDSFDLEAYIYIQCKFLNEYMLNQQDNLNVYLEPSDSIGNISYVNYNSTLQEYVYKFTCVPTGSFEDKTFPISIKWYDKPISSSDKNLNAQTGFEIIHMGAGSLNTNIEIQQGVTISAIEQELNITYYITSDNITFNPYNHLPEGRLILSGKFYNKADEGHPERYTNVTFTEITIPDSNNKFHTTYTIPQNLELLPNKLILTCSYECQDIPTDNVNNSITLTQQTANMELFLDIIPNTENTGSECDILIKIYYKLQNIIYPIPDTVSLIKENKNWITLTTSRYVEDNKTCYVYHANTYYIEAQDYDETFYRTCLFQYTFNDITIKKVFKQYQKKVDCIINYQL